MRTRPSRRDRLCEPYSLVPFRGASEAQKEKRTSAKGSSRNEFHTTSLRRGHQISSAALPIVRSPRDRGYLLLVTGVAGCTYLSTTSPGFAPGLAFPRYMIAE